MPTLTLTTNIGTDDARRLGLKNVKSGETVDVTDETAAVLIKKGWATDDAGEDADDAPEPAPVAAPASPEARTGASEPRPTPGVPTAQAEEPDLDAMTKDELKAYADRHRIPGVTLASPKDEMIRTIKRAANRPK